MSDESLLWLEPRPQLDAPVLVVMLTGWIDAGGAAHAAAEAIKSESGASPLAVFDDDTYIDFRARRPTMRLRDGLNTVLQWESIMFSVGHDSTGSDLVLLTGPEPDMAWHRFAAIVGSVAIELGIASMAHLGAYPFAVPHTRPARLSISTPSEDVLARVPFLRSSLDVPAGAAVAIEDELHQRGIPSLGIWAQVPHYIASMSYPAASVALLEGLREATGIVIEAPELRGDVTIQGQRFDAMVSGNDDHTKMIDQLERIYDASDDSVEVEMGGPTLEMRSGDELAAEFEEFLRDQD